MHRIVRPQFSWIKPVLPIAMRWYLVLHGYVRRTVQLHPKRNLLVMTMKIIIILAITLAVGAHSAYARCTDADKQACACPIRSQNTLACREQDQINVDYAVEQAAVAEVRTLTSAPLDVSADCDATSTVGQGTCGVWLWTNSGAHASDGYYCYVTYEMDGWGNVNVTDSDCGLNNG
jgi:hypothetical protein